MRYFHVCPECGANLDPGEVCDCNFSSAAGRTEEHQEAYVSFVVPTNKAMLAGAEEGRKSYE